MSQSASSIKPYLERLASMPLAIVLLMALASSSIIGTVLIQNQQQADYLSQFGPVWYWVFRSLGLFDMYHAWWFIDMLGFLMLALSLCLWRQVPRMLKEMRTRKVAVAERLLPHFQHLHHFEFTYRTVEDALILIREQLSGWEVKGEEEGGRSYIRADRGRHHKWGYIFVHVAILVILIGGLMSVQLGFRGNMSVPEGGSADSINFLKGSDVVSLKMPFAVRCNDFFIDFYPSGQPKLFRSNLTIVDNGKEVLTKDIIVNEPLYYKGVNIYQASFGDAGSALELQLFRLDGSQHITVAKGKVYETYTDPDTGILMEFTNFMPFNVENMAAAGEPKKFQDLGPAVEFIMHSPGLRPVKIKSFMNPIIVDGQNQGMLMLVSLSGEARDYEAVYLGMDLSNPKEWELFHAFIHKLREKPGKDKQEENIQAFQDAVRDVFGGKRPDDFQAMGMRVLRSVSTIPNLPWPYIPILTDYEQVYYTGLQLARDPGMNVVWVGSALLVIGLCIMLYVSHRKLWLVLEPKGKALRLTVAGMSNRNPTGFSQEFNKLIDSLEQKLRSL
ncbi:MAG: cytochrome c biogenesis protein ResB [Mariprofundaceae bacterium]